MTFSPIRLRHLLPLFAFIAFLGMNGCYKTAAENYGEEELILEDAAKAIEEADDALEVAYLSQATQKTAASEGKIVIGCGAITDDPASTTLTIHFGTTNCTGYFNRSRRGKILLNYTSTLCDSLTDKTVTFDNYYAGNRKISGTVTLHHISFSADSMQIASRMLTDFRVDLTDGSSVIFNGSHERRWVSGRGDSILRNNVYDYKGSVNGATGSGRTFTLTVGTTVTGNFYCAYQGLFAWTSGTVDLSMLQGYPSRKRTVDYGSGLCDNAVSVETFRRSYGAGTQ